MSILLLLKGERSRAQGCTRAHTIVESGFEPLSTPFTARILIPPPQVDGKFVALPFQREPLLQAHLSGTDVVVTTASGLSLAFDGNSNVRLRVPAAYAGALCGLCGNYNQDPDDDLKAVGGNPSGWQVGGDAACEQCESGPCPTPCTPEQQEAFGGPEACGVISAPDGPLAPCHDLVQPEPYFQACLQDACQAQGHPGGLCPAVAAYVVACQVVGAQLGEWRRPNFCREYSPMHGPHSRDLPASPLHRALRRAFSFSFGLRHTNLPLLSQIYPVRHRGIHILKYTRSLTAIGETQTHLLRET